MQGTVARYLARTIPAHYLALVRILFGAAITFSCFRFIYLDWLTEQYLTPKVHFPFEGFSWVVSLGSPGMEILFAVMTAAAIGVMLGAWYRFSVVIFFLAFTYIELIDKTYYLNHYYFVSIAAFLLCLVPAASAWSIDAWKAPSKKRAYLPQWTLDIFKLQLAIVYVYAGIAKITSAWLIDAMPLRIWLPAHADLPLVGDVLTHEWMPWIFAWLGMLYDLTIPFFLVVRRTRVVAYVTVIGFHIVTGLLFPIGVFPLVMIMMTLVFFLDQPAGNIQRATRPTQWKVAALGAFFALQLVIPFRFLLYPGELNWTEQGYRFSWRVMLVEKSGDATFTVTDTATGRSGMVDNSQFLTDQQERHMSYQPDMIVQYAKMLHEHYESEGMVDPIVTADVWVTMNGEASQRLIDPQVDLSKLSTGLHHYHWVLDRE